ncbi:MAG: aldo/keto reductase, partial [Acidimicrobiales bacterium]
WAPVEAGSLARPGGPVDDVASATGASASQVALAWLLRLSPVMVPIPGTSTVAHLEENTAAAAIELTDDELAALNAEFGDLLSPGSEIRCVPPRPEEVADDDHLDLARLALEFDIRHFGRLHALIARLNSLDSAPVVPPLLDDPPRG